jgi:hypothetical protein
VLLAGAIEHPVRAGRIAAAVSGLDLEYAIAECIRAHLSRAVAEKRSAAYRKYAWSTMNAMLKEEGIDL